MLPERHRFTKRSIEARRRKRGRAGHSKGYQRHLLLKAERLLHELEERTPDTGAQLSEAEIVGALQTLARFKRPKRVFLVESLPRNAMGKVQKNQLRERYADTYRAS